MSKLRSVYRTVLAGIHRAAILIGIVLFPLALVAERAGIPVPLGRLLTRLHESVSSA